MTFITHKSWLQYLPLTPDQAWTFFSDPNNLSKITPPEMDFRIISELPRKVYTGLIIEYKVSPFGNFSLPWVTEIKAVQEGSYFIDEQRFGPYKFWHHQHHFLPQGNGTVMTDILDYRLPGGWIGQWINKLFVERQIENIFAYRKKVLTELFSSS